MKTMISALIILTAIAFIGCDDDNNNQIIVTGDNTPPQVPQGVYSITRDLEVIVSWIQIDMDATPDFSTYIVYRSDEEPYTDYYEIGRTTNDYYEDFNVDNGHTYYYAVSSLDQNGNLSALSYEDVYDTPRPEGQNRRIYDVYSVPDQAGWDLWGQQTVNAESPNCDFYLDITGGVFYLNAGAFDPADTVDNFTDIQDMGYTNNFDEISYSPEFGWSENKWCEAILHHTYLIWTADNHYAKIRIISMGPDYIVFDWGFQIDEGNRELKPRPDPMPQQGSSPGDET